MTTTPTQTPTFAAPRWGRVGIFYAVALTGSGLTALAIHLLAADGLLRTGLSAMAMFAPLLATIACQRLDGAPPLGELLAWKLSRWMGVAAGVGLALSMLSLLASALLPGTVWDWQLEALFVRLASTLPPEQLEEARAKLLALPVHPVILSIPQAVIAGCTINAVFAFGEEVGWRGWLARELGTLGFWRNSLITGLLWGAWHAPLIMVGHNYPDHPVEGVFLFIGVCVGLAPWHLQVRQAGQTVWAAAMLHGTLNASAGVTALVVGGSDLVVGVPGVAGLLALLVANAALIMVRRNSRPTSP